MAVWRATKKTHPLFPIIEHRKGDGNRQMIHHPSARISFLNPTPPFHRSQKRSGSVVCSRHSYLGAEEGDLLPVLPAQAELLEPESLEGSNGSRHCRVDQVAAT